MSLTDLRARRVPRGPAGPAPLHWPRPAPQVPPYPASSAGPAPSCPTTQALLTVQPSRAVWYSAASVASLSSSWYRGQLRVGNLSSWRKRRLSGDSRVTGARLQAGGVGLWGPVSGPASLPDPAAQCRVGGSPHQDSSAPGKVWVFWLPGTTHPGPEPPLSAAGPLHLWDPCLPPSLPPPGPVQPPDLVLSNGHRVHRDRPPGGLGAPWGGLREKPR